MSDTLLIEMKTSTEAISQVKTKLSVEIMADEVDKKINKNYQQLRKKAKIKGFRPGKVPKTILERYYGDEVLADVTRSMVTETLPAALEENEIIPLTMPAVENETIKRGQSFVYTAIMEVRPKFELKDYLGLEANKPKVDISDEMVENQIEQIQKSRGQLNSLEEDRPAKMDDYVVIEYKAFENGESLEGIHSDNYLLRLGSNDFHLDFEKDILGLKKGDHKEIQIRFEDDYFHKGLAGKTVNFKVKLIEIKELEVPELDDEFAKNLGADINTLAELTDKVKSELIAQEEKKADQDVKKQLLDKISENMEFELPDSLVESELNLAFENIRQNLIRTGSNMEKVGLDENKLREELRPASEKRVKETLILMEIAKQNNITVGEADLAERFREMALSMGQSPEVIRNYYEANNILETFKDRLLEEKALNFLVEGAMITEIDADKSNEK